MGQMDIGIQPMRAHDSVTSSLSLHHHGRGAPVAVCVFRSSSTHCNIRPHYGPFLGCHAELTTFSCPPAAAALRGPQPSGAHWLASCCPICVCMSVTASLQHGRLLPHLRVHVYNCTCAAGVFMWCLEHGQAHDQANNQQTRILPPPSVLCSKNNSTTSVHPSL